ncbi:MAG: glutamine synthetase, partial [Pseudomonadota bacterium]
MTDQPLLPANRGPAIPEISLPLSPPGEERTAEALPAWLRTQAVAEVECITPDFAGIARGKVMPTSKFEKFAPIYLPTSLFFLTITGGYPDIANFTEYDTDADLWLRPD